MSKCIPPGPYCPLRCCEDTLRYLGKQQRLHAPYVRHRQHEPQAKRFIFTLQPFPSVNGKLTLVPYHSCYTQKGPKAVAQNSIRQTIYMKEVSVLYVQLHTTRSVLPPPTFRGHPSLLVKNVSVFYVQVHATRSVLPPPTLRGHLSLFRQAITSSCALRSASPT